MILTDFFITSRGTRLDEAEEEMRVERKVMHEVRSEVSNLIKLRRPPEGIREVEERRRRWDWKGG
jgi:hypothetical protein